MLVGSSRTQIDANITLLLGFNSLIDYAKTVLEQVINGLQRCANDWKRFVFDRTIELKKKANYMTKN